MIDFIGGNRYEIRMERKSKNIMKILVKRQLGKLKYRLK